MEAEITKELLFEAAHFLPSVGQSHKCSRIHGHLFKVEIVVKGEIDPVYGWVMDFGVLARSARQVIQPLDHRLLNDIPEIGIPTSENIAKYIYYNLAPKIPNLASITVHESPSSKATWSPTHKMKQMHPISISIENLLFSSAHFLILESGREPIHGHDYVVSASLNLPSDVSIKDDDFRSYILSIISKFDHHLLIPTQPCYGNLEFSQTNIVLSLPNETITLPTKDCILLDLTNTTTEGIAMVIAQRVKEDCFQDHWKDVSLTVAVKESLSCEARYTVSF